MQDHFWPTDQIRSVQAAKSNKVQLSRLKLLKTCRVVKMQPFRIQSAGNTSRNKSKDGSHCGSSSHFQSFRESWSILIYPNPSVHNASISFQSAIHDLIMSTLNHQSAELLQRKEYLGHAATKSEIRPGDFSRLDEFSYYASLFGDDRAISFAKAIPNLSSHLLLWHLLKPLPS